MSSLLRKILKKTAYGKNIERQFDLMYGGLGIGKGGVRNPKELYSAYKHKNKDATRSEAIAKTALLRTVNGPELNILLCGIPFLVTCGVGEIEVQIRNEKKRARNKARDRAAAAQGNAAANAVQAPARILKFKEGAFDKMVTKDGKPAAKGRSWDKAAPLPSAPYSSAFVGLHRKLQDAGLSSETASQVVGGSYGDEDLESSLSEEEAGIVADVLGTYLQDEAASPGGEE